MFGSCSRQLFILKRSFCFPRIGTPFLLKRFTLVWRPMSKRFVPFFIHNFTVWGSVKFKERTGGCFKGKFEYLRWEVSLYSRCMQILQPRGIKNVRLHLLHEFGNTVCRPKQFPLYIYLKLYIISFIYSLFLQLFIKASATFEFFVEFVSILFPLPMSENHRSAFQHFKHTQNLLNLCQIYTSSRFF